MTWSLIEQEHPDGTVRHVVRHNDVDCTEVLKPYFAALAQLPVALAYRFEDRFRSLDCFIILQKDGSVGSATEEYSRLVADMQKAVKEHGAVA